MALTVTSVTPSAVEDNGGGALDFAGTFDLGVSVALAVVVGGLEYPCYSGRAGEAYAPLPRSAALVHAVAPPLPLGGPYSIVVRQGASEVTLVAALTVRNRSFRSRTSALRQLMPPPWRSGPRRLDVTDPLAIPPDPFLLTESSEHILTENGDDVLLDEA